MKSLAVIALVTGTSFVACTPTHAQQAPEQNYPARVAKAEQDIQAIQTALLMFKFDSHMYPTQQMGLKALVVNPMDSRIHWRNGGYLRRLPKDPWGNDYQYRIPGTHGRDYEVFSFGDGGVKGQISKEHRSDSGAKPPLT